MPITLRAGVQEDRPSLKDPCRVVLIDDDHRYRRFLERSLSKAGYRVLATGTGRETLELCARQRPDVLMLDWRLANGPMGERTLRSLKSCQQTRAIPVVVMSGVVRDKSAEIGPALAGAREALPRVVERGRLRIDLDAGRVSVRGRLRRVGPQRFELLRVLVAHPQGADRETLLREAWRDATDFNLLAKTIQRLKKDLGVVDAVVFRAGCYRLLG